MKTVDWTPNDYSPTYRVGVREDRTIELLAVFDIPPIWPDAKELPIEAHHREYVARNFDFPKWFGL